MNQSIDFYQHLDHAQAERFSALQGAYAAGLLFLVLMLVAVYLVIVTGLTDKHLTEDKRELGNLQRELQTLQAQMAILVSDESLQAMQDAIKQRRSVLDSISDERQPLFSDYMDGLGRQHVDGLWLEHVFIGLRGQHIELKGAMREASLLPRYLQRLSNESVFQGLRFQLMKIEDEPDIEQQLRFEIAVIPEISEAASDAAAPDEADS